MIAKEKNTGNMAKKLTSFNLTAALYKESLAKKFDLNPTSFLVLIGLTTHFNPEKQTVFPSQLYLAEHLNISERSVIRSMKELIAKNIILKTKKGLSNVYCFTNIFFESLNLSSIKCQNVAQLGDKLAYKQDNKNKIKNILPFNLNNGESAMSSEKNKRVEDTKQLLKEYKEVQKASPLDFDYEEAKKYVENLPPILKNSYFARELRKKWGFDA